MFYCDEYENNNWYRMLLTAQVFNTLPQLKFIES
jgi:hypothetical protein